jgi:hypothetical protein
VMSCLLLPQGRITILAATGARLLQGWAPAVLTGIDRPTPLASPAWAWRPDQPNHLPSSLARLAVASVAIPLTSSCSRWWSRSLRRRSSCPPGASWSRR